MTILELLEDALEGLTTPFYNSIMSGAEQLRRAIDLLSMGYAANTNIDELIAEYGDLDSVPHPESKRMNQYDADQAWRILGDMKKQIEKLEWYVIEQSREENQ